MSDIDYRQPFILPPNRVWRSYLGGRVLDEIQGVQSPADSHFPEDWVGSATRAINPPRDDAPADEGISIAQTGDGRTIAMSDIFSYDPVAALGHTHLNAFGTQPQLLVKLLDSSIRLHIQAHPSVPWAQQHLQSNSGKTESWYVLATRDDDASVLFGFQHPPTSERWGRIIREQDVDAMLACFEPVPVKPGDLLLIPGGLPHAVGAGITMIETQEPTDYVVRCEYSLPDVKSPPATESSATMNLGIQGVLDMFDYTQYPVSEVKKKFGPRPEIVKQTNEGCETALLYKPQTDRLELRSIAVNDSGQGFLIADDERFSILIVTEGEGTLSTAGNSIHIRKWSKVFLPAILDDVRITGNMKLTRCMPPLP